jgi:hypothetical protein
MVTMNTHWYTDLGDSLILRINGVPGKMLINMQRNDTVGMEMIVTEKTIIIIVD